MRGKILAGLAALTLLIGASNAQTVDVNASVNTTSKVLFKGRECYGASVQPDVNVNYGNINLDFWGNVELGTGTNVWMVTPSYGFNLPHVKGNSGLNYIAFTNPTIIAHEGYISAVTDFPFSPRLKITDNFEGRIYSEVGASETLEVLGQNVNVSGSVAGEYQSHGRDGLTHGRVNVKVPVKVGKITIMPTFSYFEPLRDDFERHFVFSASVEGGF